MRFCGSELRSGRDRAAYYHLKVTIASKQGGVVYSTIEAFSGGGSYTEVVELTELPDQGFDHPHS